MVRGCPAAVVLGAAEVRSEATATPWTSPTREGTIVIRQQLVDSVPWLCALLRPGMYTSFAHRCSIMPRCAPLDGRCIGSCGFPSSYEYGTRHVAVHRPGQLHRAAGTRRRLEARQAEAILAQLDAAAATQHVRHHAGGSRRRNLGAQSWETSCERWHTLEANASLCDERSGTATRWPKRTNELTRPSR